MIRFTLFAAACLAGTGLAVYLLYAEGDTPPPPSPLAPEGPATPTGAVPERLRRLKEDRDNEIRQARLEAHEHGTKYLRALEEFEIAAQLFCIEWQHYIQDGPTLAALGHAPPPPRRLEYDRHIPGVKLAAEAWRRALEQLAVKVERIEFRYRKELAALEQPGAGSSGKGAPPATKLDRELRFAEKLLPRTKQVVDDIMARVKHALDTGLAPRDAQPVLRKYREQLDASPPRSN